MSRRETILEAALESFGASGATTIDDVRRRSGASVGSIYHHFGGKDGIAVALYVEILRGYQAGVVRTLGRAPDAEAGVRALVRHHLHWVERNPDRARFLLQGGVAREYAGDELKALNQDMFATVSDWVELQSAIRPLRREIFYAAVFGPAQELSRSWLGGRTRSLRRLEDELAEAAWRAVRAD
ncbi:MAG TPA: TetR/AcrR family transcriptional regulator [Solirubrobacterales bacterium]|jgi:AcrR family transcriptional regulator|nr:TetR/AcrR family transcriptional regulator [Solirubrobacterales bacterium]